MTGDTAPNPASASVLFPPVRNFRSLEGVEVGGGRRIAPRRLYRSAALGGLEPDDIRELDALGIRVVCDLRTERERSRGGSPWDLMGAAPSLLTREALATYATGEALRDRFRSLLGDATGVEAREYMLEMHRAMPREFAPTLALLFESIDREGVPVLINCAAGKDRTGFIVAMVLTALGASDEAIVEDYLRSNEFIDFDTLTTVLLQASGADFAEPAAIEALMVNAEYLAESVAQIEREWESVPAFLATECGLTGSRRARLAAALTL